VRFPSAVVEAHVEDMEQDAQWRCTRRRSGHRWVCGREITGLGFRGSRTLKKKNSNDGWVNYICTPVAKEE
jgi:hypothetical protein